MLKRIGWFALLLIVSNSTWCQDTVHKNVALLLSPVLAPVSTTELALQPGVEVYLQRWSLTAQLAFLLHKPHQNFSHINYLRESLEVKRFFNPAQRVQKYLSAEVLYTQRRFTDTNGGVYFKSEQVLGNRYQYSHAQINSPIFVAVLKAGLQAHLGKRFFWDTFLGLGVRTIYTKYSDVQGEEPLPYGLLELSGPKGAYRFDKTMSKPQVTGGLKLGYVL